MKFSFAWHTLNAWTRVATGFLCSFGCLLILTLFGAMQTPLALIALAPLGIALTSAGIALIKSRDRVRLTLLSLLILIPLSTLSGEIPSIFTGRDQGSIAQAAWQLAQNGNLYTRSAVSDAFFNIYGPGTALNFPGFAYTTTGSLVTQFPLGYTAWLAPFVAWFGLAGFHLGNSLLFILAGWAFFELALLFIRRPLALIGTGFFTASFLPVWLLHHTLSEHLALLLFLIIGLALVTLFRAFEAPAYWIALGGASLFVFTRIEGWAILGVTLTLILLAKPSRTYLLARPWIRIILPLSLFGFFWLRDFFVNLPFYTMIGKAVIKKWHELTLLGMPTGSSVGELSLLSVFTLYGLAFWFIIGTIGILIALWKKERLLLVLIVLALPTFIYLVDSHITPDHPWMLRRYVFTLWPTFLLAGIWIWQYAEEHLPQLRTPLITTFLTGLLIVMHIPATQVAWRMDESSALLAPTAAIAERLSGQDLILIDRLASGDPHALIAGPLFFLYGKQAAYFFNPEDFKRLDFSAFERVFILTSPTQAETLTKTIGRVVEERAAFVFPIEKVIGSQSALTPTTRLTKTRSFLYEIK